MCLVSITDAILSDENAIITVSNYDEENEIYIGLPAIINKTGVSKKMKVNLTAEEEAKFKNSIRIIKEAIAKISE